jgi:hypothetical protein
MSATTPLPHNLRAALLQQIEELPDEDLPLVHEVLLHAEKERLWREISAGAECDRLEGKWVRLPQMIEEVRGRLRSSP